MRNPFTVRGVILALLLAAGGARCWPLATPRPAPARMSAPPGHAVTNGANTVKQGL